MKATAFNIIYDTDGLEVNLPKELTFAVSSEEKIGDIAEIISDRISDETGFCHLGFEIKF